MDGSRFDDFARALVTSRRGALKTLLGGAAAGIAAVVTGGAAQACSSLRRRCAADGDCCSGACDPASGRCVCGSGTEECGRDCIAEEQYQTDAENCGGCRNRCRSASHATAVCTGGVCGIECDAGYALCGDRCCADDRECCDGDCCGPNQCCSAEGCVLCRCGIGIDSFDNGEINPDNACQYCDPTRDRDDWTTKSDGAFCGDGRVCCNGDCCSPTECCDGVQCTDVNCPDQCEILGQPVEAGQTNGPGSCQVCKPERNRFDWTLLDDQDPCGGVSGRVCCNGECCSPTECCRTTSCEECGPHCRIGDADIPEDRVNPANLCEACKPDVNFNDWTTLDDDTACGVGRVCCNGECCPAGQCCTDGVCGECRCEMGDGFDRDDVNPFNACQICNPDQSRDDWSPGPPNTACGGLGNNRFCCAGDCCPADECCNAIGECVTCACVISGNPVQERAVNPANTCQVCDSNENRRDWTVLDDDEACGTDTDDRVCCSGTCCAQGECCEDGACKACGCEIEEFGEATIEPGTVNLDNVCQICDPSRERFDWSPVLGVKACGEDGKGTCCAGDCCPEDQCCLLDACGECLCHIGDTNYAAERTNPDNDCEVCKPKLDPFGWTAAANRAPCGVNGDQVCCAGGCCEPGQCCNAESVCGFCGCKIGDLEPAKFAINPENECEWCDPDLDQFAWSPRSDEPCGANGDQVCCIGICCPDGQRCSVAGACEPRGCDIGGVHYADGTRNPAVFCEVCDSDFPNEWSPRFHPDCPPPCIIDGTYVDYGTPNPDNECEECDGGRSVTSWSPKDHNTRCGPGQEQFCCQSICCESGACCTPAGACAAGGALVCDGCGIDGRFVPNDEANPANSCEHCDTGLSTSAWSPQRNNTSCDSGGDHRVCCNRLCCSPGELCVESEMGNFLCTDLGL